MHCVDEVPVALAHAVGFPGRAHVPLHRPRDQPLQRRSSEHRNLRLHNDEGFLGGVDAGLRPEVRGDLHLCMHVRLDKCADELQRAHLPPQVALQLLPIPPPAKARRIATPPPLLHAADARRLRGCCQSSEVLLELVLRVWLELDVLHHEGPIRQAGATAILGITDAVQQQPGLKRGRHEVPMLDLPPVAGAERFQEHLAHDFQLLLVDGLRGEEAADARQLAAELEGREV
mmetsp:Transcript_38541/g.111146  ORF Transcript_38541/g.111146 Transcript_38541/m.111146 type:complete len:231 (+) Transcript_38541:411-1103(+)